MVEGEELREVSQNWGGTEPKRTVTCMVLKACANDRYDENLCFWHGSGKQSKNAERSKKPTRELKPPKLNLNTSKQLRSARPRPDANFLASGTSAKDTLPTTVVQTGGYSSSSFV
ncbi:hypothetical protein TNCV_26311 [Trichonephila clavipes]|uniref:Uncharacterized protein n=1 Tax=Trichonephila clavipes TaxID=2585209 RepID=A0A8X7BDA6_TRICX|nr:hypothetical protein TNCV_26311 [Trichonephila clavipes]